MSYSVREVSAMLGLTAGQIRAWTARGFLNPERNGDGDLRFGFQDLVILRTAGELTAAHIPTRKIRRVLESVREQLPEGRSIAGVRIAADGERVVVRRRSEEHTSELQSRQYLVFRLLLEKKREPLNTGKCNIR